MSHPVKARGLTGRTVEPDPAIGTLVEVLVDAGSRHRLALAVDPRRQRLAGHLAFHGSIVAPANTPRSQIGRFGGQVWEPDLAISCD